MALFPIYPRMDGATFAALAGEGNDLRGELAGAGPPSDASTDSDVLRLLRRAAAVHREPPYPRGTLASLASEEVVSLNEQIAEALGDALAFVPRDVLREFGRHHQYDIGAIALECEAPFILHLVRAGVPLQEGAAQVGRFALLIELWGVLRAEELQRLEDNQLGVLLAMLVRDDPEAEEALTMLVKRYLSGEVRKTFQAALEAQPTVIRKVVDVDAKTATSQPASWEELNAERNAALGATLSPFRAMSPREFYIRVMDRDRGLQYLPASIHRDAQNLLRQLRAACRTLPGGGTLVSLDAERAESLLDAESQGHELTDMMPGAPGSGGAPDTLREAANKEAVVSSAAQGRQVEKAIELIRQYLGDEAAQVIAAFLRPDSPCTAVGVAEELGVHERTIRRVLQRIREHEGLRQALPDLLT